MGAAGESLSAFVVSWLPYVWNEHISKRKLFSQCKFLTSDKVYDMEIDSYFI